MYNNLKKVFTLVMGLTAFGLFNTASADWWLDSDGGISAGDAQDIVISLKSNPMANPEAACLAVTFARSLSGGANVTLFVTLDGVTIADDKVASSRRFKCETPWGEVSLKENLLAFLTDEVVDENDVVVEVVNQNKLVVCPICWNSRYDDELPDYGVLPINPDGPPDSPPDVDGDDHIVWNKAIGKMMLDADKILDF